MADLTIVGFAYQDVFPVFGGQVLVGRLGYTTSLGLATSIGE